MKFPPLAVRLCLMLGTTVACIGSPARAEVSMRVVGDRCESALVMMSIVEDPDPFGSRVWTPFRSGRVTVTINRSGERRGDLFPDLVFDPDACVVQLAWPFRRGNGRHGIVFQEVRGNMPGPLQFLGGGEGTDLEPRIDRESDGTLHVTWWTETFATREAFVRTRPAGATKWQAARPVTAPGEQGRQPSVLGLDGTLLLAYERLPAIPGGPHEIVVATIRDDEVVARETVATVEGRVPARPLLHRSGGRIWIDWRAGPEALGYAERTPAGWSEPGFLKAGGATWVELEGARSLSRKQLFGESGPLSVPVP